MRRYLTSTILWVSILGTIGGCGGPRVDHSPILPSLHSVDSWVTRWNNAGNSREDITVRDAGDRTDNDAWADYCQSYIGAVKHHLIADHGINFAENFPQRGIIELEIISRTVSEFAPPDTAAEERFRGGPGEDTYPHGPSPVSSDVLLGLGELLFDNKVKVDSVAVRFYDLDGKSAGWASMTSKNVKPSQAAKVISNLITDGHHKGATVQVKLRPSD